MTNTTKASSTDAKKNEEKPVIAAVPNQAQEPNEETVQVHEGEIVDNRSTGDKIKGLLRNKKALAGMVGAVAAGSLLIIIRLRNTDAGVNTEAEDETLSA